MTEAERQQKLTLLEKEFQRFVSEERSRLTAERRFLQSVLDNSLGGPTERATELSKLAALASVRQLAQVT
jgi:hypothetical protein